MADKPCRWFNPSDYEWDEAETCAHPLLMHFSGGVTSPIRPGSCHGCPCHEPQGLVFRSAEEVFKHYGVTLTDDGHEPFDPDPTPTGGKTGHDKP